MSAYTIVWSPRAKITYYKILEYLEEKWTYRESNAFIERVEQVIDHITKTPLHYPYSKEHDVYKSVFLNQVSLFYRIRYQKIELLVFWDNRQDPANLNL